MEDFDSYQFLAALHNRSWTTQCSSQRKGVNSARLLELLTPIVADTIAG